MVGDGEQSTLLGLHEVHVPNYLRSGHRQADMIACELTPQMGNGHAEYTPAVGKQHGSEASCSSFLGRVGVRVQVGIY